MFSSRPPPGRWRTAAIAGVLVSALAGCAPSQDSSASSTSRAPSSSQPEASSSAHPAWADATYRTTCGSLVQGHLAVKLVDSVGQAPVDVSQSASYVKVDVQLEATATGNLEGDGDPDTVVLLRCTPQPSNGSVEEVHVFRADGTELGVLPNPSTLAEASVIAPLYVPAGLTIQNGQIVAPMKAYGPDDSHASGPTVPLTVRWTWNGRSFVRVP